MKQVCNSKRVKRKFALQEAFLASKYFWWVTCLISAYILQIGQFVWGSFRSWNSNLVVVLERRAPADAVLLRNPSEPFSIKCTTIHPVYPRSKGGNTHVVTSQKINCLQQAAWPLPWNYSRFSFTFYRIVMPNKHHYVIISLKLIYRIYRWLCVGELLKCD